MSIWFNNLLVFFNRKVLYDARQERPRPHLDDKIITSWNGLMIRHANCYQLNRVLGLTIILSFSGLCAAAGALNRPDYLESAVTAADFIRANLFLEDKGVLLRSTYTTKEVDSTYFV